MNKNKIYKICDDQIKRDNILINTKNINFLTVIHRNQS